MPCSANTPSYLHKDLQPVHPVAVVLEEVLQFPNVLQQVGVCGAIAQALLEQLRALGHAGDVLHQNFLLVGRNLGA